MNWLKANWKSIMWALIAIAAIILLWIIFHPAPAPNDHSQEKKTIDSLISVIQVLKKHDYEIVKIDSSRIELSKTKYDSMQKVNESLKIKAQALDANGKYYALLYHNEKDKGNIAPAFEACDQIIQILDSESRIIRTFQSLSDSIEIQTNIQLNLKDSIIQTTQALLQYTDNALQTTNKAYQGLSKDYAGQVKANKRNRTLARVLALSTLILGGTVYLLAK